MDNKSNKNAIQSLFINLVPAAVLTWSLAVLTASYFGMAKSVDSAFISSLVTTVLASYGITKVQEKKEKDDKDF
jgi:phosphate/sulfate permease